MIVLTNENIMELANDLHIESLETLSSYRSEQCLKAFTAIMQLKTERDKAVKARDGIERRLSQVYESRKAVTVSRDQEEQMRLDLELKVFRLQDQLRSLIVVGDSIIATPHLTHDGQADQRYWNEATREMRDEQANA